MNYLRLRTNLFGQYTIAKCIGGYMVDVQYSHPSWGIDFRRRVEDWDVANNILDAAAEINKNYGG